MGLPTSPSPADGVLPFILINAALSVALVKKKLQLLLQFVFGESNHWFHYGDDDHDDQSSAPGHGERRVSIRRFGNGNHRPAAADCCLCLCRYEPGEEVSELSCRHFFHKDCIEKWFDKHRSSCPLCRSIS